MKQVKNKTKNETAEKKQRMAAIVERLKELYPEVYERIMARRAFAEEQIGLKLKEDLLPLANSFANFNPYALKKGFAIKVKK